MPTTQQAVAQPETKNRYLEDQIKGMTPNQLLIKVYDAAIASCIQKNRVRLSRALVELISALNWDHREVALGLFRLYNFCLRNAKLGKFNVVEPIISELRDAWNGALKMPAPVTVDTEVRHVTN